MDLHDALRTRRTIHAFADGPLPEDVLHRALDAAHHAPNHKLTFPWRFLVAGPETRRALADLAVLRKQEAGTLDPAQVAAVRAPLERTGALVVVGRVPADDPFRAREDYAAVACAIHALLLSLHADGYGGKWGTGALTRDPDARAILGLAGDPLVVEGFVYAGHPASVPRVVRPPLTEHLRRLP